MSTGSSAHNSKIPLWAVAKIKEQQETIRELVDALRPFAYSSSLTLIKPELHSKAAELVTKHGDNHE